MCLMSFTDTDPGAKSPPDYNTQECNIGMMLKEVYFWIKSSLLIKLGVSFTSHNLSNSQWNGSTHGLQQQKSGAHHFLGRNRYHSLRFFESRSNRQLYTLRQKVDRRKARTVGTRPVKKNILFATRQCQITH